jgi:hypothetical protein
MRKYTTTIKIPTHLTIDTMYRALDIIRQYGSGELLLTTTPKIKAQWQAEDDWDLREVLYDVKLELNAIDIDFEISRDNVE